MHYHLKLSVSTRKQRGANPSVAQLQSIRHPDFSAAARPREAPAAVPGHFCGVCHHLAPKNRLTLILQTSVQMYSQLEEEFKKKTETFFSLEMKF